MIKNDKLLPVWGCDVAIATALIDEGAFLYG